MIVIFDHDGMLLDFTFYAGTRFFSDGEVLFAKCPGGLLFSGDDDELEWTEDGDVIIGPMDGFDIQLLAPVYGYSDEEMQILEAI